MKETDRQTVIQTERGNEHMNERKKDRKTERHQERKRVITHKHKNYTLLRKDGTKDQKKERQSEEVK